MNVKREQERIISCLSANNCAINSSLDYRFLLNWLRYIKLSLIYIVFQLLGIYFILVGL